MLEPNPSIQVDRQDATSIITFNRPERLNAITRPMMQRLSAALDEAGDDATIRAVIITGSGKGFCVGQDLVVLAKMYEHNDPASIADLLRNDYNPVIERIRRLPKPVIAAVQGVAAGAGWSIALSCDVCLAAASAQFVPAFAALGLVPDMGGTTALVQALGYRRALEFTLLTEDLPADKARDMGLINHVVPDVELLPTALMLAKRIAAKPAGGVRFVKEALRAAMESDPAAQLEIEARVQASAAADPEHRERVTAFVARHR